MQKCALYFGSFNPLHYGHLSLARYVMCHCDIDRFIMVLSPHNPFKKVDELAEPAERLAALRREISVFNDRFREETAGRTGKERGKRAPRCRELEVSDIEFGMEEPLYTYNTLCEFRRRIPETEFYLVVGADSFSSLPRWYRGEDILGEFRVIVYPRKGFRVKEMAERYNAIYLDGAPLNNISSTEVRNGTSGTGLQGTGLQGTGLQNESQMNRNRTE